ncbi:MAG: trypsin-like peptidase domain-containing protein [Cytophagaceae bacterium]|nr:trypsin-like peptidase domain-containing protein [Cytophagaceae bacterium]
MKNNLKALLLVGLLSSATTLAAYKIFGLDKKEIIVNENVPSAFTRLTSNVPAAGNPGDFTYAAEKTTPAVVHIKSTIVREVSRRQQQMPDIFEEFFGESLRQQQPQRQEGRASGSGVIISADGYIVTNNHVVAESKELEVVLNDRRSYKAKLIGRDPNTDIAVIKIDAKDLPFITFGDSDGVKVGEWVLAVGNPFDLESTVTAGIISAKGRGIGILDYQNGNPIESFIQTDAAVNPGNSGGALVNLKGELVGINTAIAGSPQTGTYVGYAFAVPTSIVKKVAGDLLKYGTVQRAFLGISKMQEVTNTVADQLDLKATSGIYVGGFSTNASLSAAKTAGVKIGDVVTKIDGVQINTVSALVERVGRKKPGDNVMVTVNRNGEIKDLNVILKNISGTTSIVKGDEVADAGTESGNSVSIQTLGLRVGDLSGQEKEEFRLTGGAKILQVSNGVVSQQTDISEGFIVTKVNNVAIKSASDFAKAVAGKRSGIRIEGVYAEDPSARYSYSF